MSVTSVHPSASEFTLNFWTPVEFFNFNSENVQTRRSTTQKIIESIENYFAPTSGLKGCVYFIKGKLETHLRYRQTPAWKTSLKVISYFTLVIPALALIAKIIIRRKYHFTASKELNSVLISQTFTNLNREAVCVNANGHIEKEIRHGFPSEVSMKQAINEVIMDINKLTREKGLNETLVLNLEKSPIYKEESGRKGNYSIYSVISIEENIFSPFKKDWLTAIFEELESKKYIQILRDESHQITLKVNRSYSIW